MYQAVMLFFIMTLLCGVIYPLIVFGIGQTFFHKEANGSLISRDGVVIGSELIAQSFKDPKYFWPRPSASDHGTIPSAASNLGPTSRALSLKIDERRRQFAEANKIDEQHIPNDMLTTSASGLDPHISLASARLQVERISHARALDENHKAQLMRLIDDMAEQPKLAKFSKKMLNVLMLNLKMEKMLTP